MDSDFSDDEQDEDGLGDDEYLPTNHGVPCDQCVWFVAKDQQLLQITALSFRRWLCHRVDMSCLLWILSTFVPAFLVSSSP